MATLTMTPAEARENAPALARVRETVARGRAEVARVLHGLDDRSVVIVGPCSIHDTAAALEYAERLAPLATALADDLCIVMRAYFEKPRSVIGWKGFINDPHLDGSCAIETGLRRARALVLAIAERGVPIGCEFLNPLVAPFIEDLVSWGAIGARTVESQIHRELASALTMPVGFKNSTAGDVGVAIDAVRASAHAHGFLGLSSTGRLESLATSGNPDGHVILRGGTRGVNYAAVSVQRTATMLRAAGLPARLMIDLSHGNSDKDYRRQPLVAQAVAAQIAGGEGAIMGVMIESFLVDGRQDLRHPATLMYGQSVTDGCLGWDETTDVLRQLAAAVRSRRGRGRAYAEVPAVGA